MKITILFVKFYCWMLDFLTLFVFSKNEVSSNQASYKYLHTRDKKLVQQYYWLLLLYTPYTFFIFKYYFFSYHSYTQSTLCITLYHSHTHYVRLCLLPCFILASVQSFWYPQLVGLYCDENLFLLWFCYYHHSCYWTQSHVIIVHSLYLTGRS